MKKIVLINQASGYLFIDIANAFAKDYDEVVLMAGTVVSMNTPLDPQIKWVTIKQYNKDSVFKRMVSWLVAFIQVFFLVKTKYRKHELFISSNPPLACLLPAFCSNPSSLLIYDIYPDGLVAGKFLSASNIIIRQWERLNRKVYKKVNRIITLTNGMANLISKYIELAKIDVVPAWANDAPGGIILQEENEFVKKYNLRGKFLVVYSGNLGLGYSIETLVHVANYMKENTNVMFLVIGEGWKKKVAEELIAELGLTNCKVLPKQSSALFVHLMQAMHIGVVSLAKEASKIAVPSKTYNILAGGKPLLCLGDKDSELAELIEKYDVGATFNADEIERIATFIKTLSVGDVAWYHQLCTNAKMTAVNFTSHNAEKIVRLVKDKTFL